MYTWSSSFNWVFPITLILVTPNILLIFISCLTNWTFTDTTKTYLKGYFHTIVSVFLCTNICLFLYKILYTWLSSFNWVFPITLILSTPNILLIFISCLTNSTSIDTTKAHLKGYFHTPYHNKCLSVYKHKSFSL